jgi:hypothetical protein
MDTRSSRRGRMGSQLRARLDLRFVSSNTLHWLAVFKVYKGHFAGTSCTEEMSF